MLHYYVSFGLHESWREELCKFPPVPLVFLFLINSCNFMKIQVHSHRKYNKEILMKNVF